ncbi:M56 family metallopeptidase [Chitinophagaceae bacterium MMS25-I14]
MLQYLLNATAIWTLSLLCFELFLKKETYHGLNRLYLLTTLLLGLLIPLWTWPSSSRTLTAVANQSLYYRASHARQAIVQAVSTTGGNSSVSWQMILLTAYIGGAAISIVFVIKELTQLFRYYRRGIKQYDANWLIIETGRQHSPFSLLHMIFISDRKTYSSDQWQIVLQHEQQHSRLGHFADMLLLQLLQIAFWFHPLVYIYRRKLLLVHEYQADAASVADLKQYGQFLLEQTMLRSAPSVTHSFNYSPIKNRIFMLTRKNPSRTFSARYLLFFPILFLSLACSKGNASDGGGIGKWKKEGNKATNNGNVLEFSSKEIDTVIMIDPATGAQHSSVLVTGEQPLKLNGSRIYADPETAPVYEGGANWETALFNTLHPDLDKLGDGKYELSIYSMIIDKTGKLIYYESNGLEQIHAPAPITAENNGKPGAIASSEKVEKVDEALKQRINDRINSFLNSEKNTRFKPATVNGLPAATMTHFNYGIKVSGHHAVLVK